MARGGVTGPSMARDGRAREYLEPFRAFISEWLDAFARRPHSASDNSHAARKDRSAGDTPQSARRSPGQQEPRQLLSGTTDLCTRAPCDVYPRGNHEVLRLIIGAEVTSALTGVHTGP